MTEALIVISGLPGTTAANRSARCFAEVAAIVRAAAGDP